MRIRIEIDGRTVLDTDVPAFAEARKAPYTPDEQPPEELLREARARGAENAGRAAYLEGASASLASGALSDATAAALAGSKNKLDGDAGHSVEAKPPSRTTSARATRKQTKAKKRR
jgi:hypothetical protein